MRSRHGAALYGAVLDAAGGRPRRLRGGGGRSGFVGDGAEDVFVARALAGDGQLLRGAWRGPVGGVLDGYGRGVLREFRDDGEAAGREEDEYQQGEAGRDGRAHVDVVDGGVHGPAQVVGGLGGQRTGVAQGVRDGIEVAGEPVPYPLGGVGQPGREGRVGDRAEQRGAHALADLAAEEHGGRRRAALRVADGRLDADDQR